jgi:hypothetical protein
MALPPVTDAASKYASRASGAAAEWVAGAQRTDVDPTQLAAAAIASGKAAQNYAAAGSRMQRGLAAAGKGGWLAGITRPEAASQYSNGVSGKGKDKWATAMNTWFPIFASIQSQIRSMPNTTTQDSINRAAAWITQTKQAKANL